MSEAKNLLQSEPAEVWLASCLDAEHVTTVMRNRIAEALIFDAPFSSRTHVGHKNGKLTADRAAKFAARDTGNARKRERAYSGRKAAKGESGRRDIDYEFWSATQVRSFCDLWLPRTNGWIVTITDDVLAPAWRTSFVRHGLYPFAPLPLVETGSRVRMTGDGPSGWTCWLVVARPRSREWASWGTLPGAYVFPGERVMNCSNGTERIVGGKSQAAMDAIIRDYSAPDALVVDPTCGAGTTGIAAKRQGRRFIGVDVKPEHAELSAARLLRTRHQVSIPGSERIVPLEQSTIFERIDQGVAAQ